MAQDKRFTNGITEGVIWRQLLLFFFPILLGTFFSSCITRWTPWWWAGLWAKRPWPP